MNTPNRKGLVLCLAREVRYLIFVRGVSITQRRVRTSTCAHERLQRDERWVSTGGPGDQLGQEHQTMPQSAAAAHWECESSVLYVCV